MTSAIGIDLLKQLSVLQQGRTPILASQGWHYGGAASPPTLITAGVDVDGAIWAVVGVRQRASGAAWRSFYRVDVADAGEDYGVIFATGPTTTTTVTITGEATKAGIIAALKTALEASSPFTSAGGSCALVDGQEDLLAISFEEPVAVARAGSVNANESCCQEADRTLWRVWGLPLGLDSWCLLRDVEPRLSTQAAELATVLCAGYRRLFVEVVESDGLVQLLVGPCRRDDQAAALLEDAATQLTTAAAGLYAFPTTAGGGRIFDGGWSDAEVEVGTTPVLLTRGSERVEIQNRTGATLHLRLGAQASTDSGTVPDGEVWDLGRLGAVYGVLASGSGPVIVRERRA